MINARTPLAALAAAFVLLTPTALLHAEVPKLLNYQGRVAVGTTNFDGPGEFKFALVNAAGDTSYWSNDGTSTTGNAPTLAVALTVTKGLYSVLLGDATLANMTAIPASVFANADVHLRVWFDDGSNGVQLLAPDQRIAAVGYALSVHGLAVLGDNTVFLHASGSDSFFAGDGAGNLGTTGTGGNTGVGTESLSFNTNGYFNTAIGADSLQSNTTGYQNTALGHRSLRDNTEGFKNTALGEEALRENETGSSNIAIGEASMRSMVGGNSNTAVGSVSLFNNQGSDNIALGHLAGADLTTGDNNIAIGNLGVAGEANTIRIGTSQTDTYLTGVIHGDGSGLTDLPASAPTDPVHAATPQANMVWIREGSFAMGSPSFEVDRYADEGPQTSVTISRGFWMGIYEVTQAQYLAVVGSNPSNFTGDTSRPVESVSWNDAVAYCAALTTSERAAGRCPATWSYRLPTEAEWEYAARAGTATRFSHGDDPGYTSLGNYAWLATNSGATTHPVGQKAPNAWGLFDMHGNVWEWCQDSWDFSTNYPGGSTIDPLGTSGSIRVVRGGSWGSFAVSTRCANRDYSFVPGFTSVVIGFRAVLAPGQP